MNYFKEVKRGDEGVFVQPFNLEVIEASFF
jgi:hypothetical protein